MTVPRWTVPLLWAVLVFIIQILAPWLVSQIGPRYGWVSGTPSAANAVGLAAVATGLGLYAWCLVHHFKGYRESVQLRFEPPELVITGPYEYSRNPMYAAGLLAWLGWTAFFGSPAVLVAAALLWAVFHLRVIPAEERMLEAVFGQSYLDYQRSVRRWFGRVR